MADNDEARAREAAHGFAGCPTGFARRSDDQRLHSQACNTLTALVLTQRREAAEAENVECEKLLSGAADALSIAVSVLMRPVASGPPDPEMLDARMACLKSQDAIAARRRGERG